MKYSPHYYIQKIGNSLDSFPYAEIKVDDTRLIVVNIRSNYETIYRVYFTTFGKDASGWYYNVQTTEIVKFHCCKHYVDRFRERYLKDCKRDNICITRVFAKRIAMANLTDKGDIAVEPKKDLIHIVRVSTKRDYRYIQFITCYRDVHKSRSYYKDNGGCL